MLKKSMFIKPKIQLEGQSGDNVQTKDKPTLPEEVCTACPGCKAMLFIHDLEEEMGVCPKCGYHFRLGARSRIALIADEGSFCEHDGEMAPDNIIGFEQYEKKLHKAQKTSGEKDAALTGVCRIEGIPCAIFAMDPQFMMGSMGTVVGEKITRLFEFATRERLPVVGFTVSGGARMQEGIFSLMQMAKTSGAVERHSAAGNFYLTVLTDPTTGGVTASFAMEGDIILSEPKALIGFAGPRVIEQTMRQKLPEGFQRAEFLLEKGFVDKIVDRREEKKLIAVLLRLHCKEVGA